MMKLPSDRMCTAWISIVAVLLYFPSAIDGQGSCENGGFCMDPSICTQLGSAGRPSALCATAADQPSLVCCFFSLDNPITAPTENPLLTTMTNPLFETVDAFPSTTFNPFGTSQRVIPDGPLSPLGGSCGRVSALRTESFGFAFAGSSSTSVGAGLAVADPNLFDLVGINVEGKEDANKVVNVSMRGDERSLKRSNRVKRIVGGDVVPSNDLCYQVAIMQGDTLISTGALISNDFVISTYSPLMRLTGSNANGRGLRVILGGANVLPSVLQDSTADVYPVTQVFPVPAFIQKTALGYPSSDMALLRFNRNNAALDTSRICAICLPPRPLSQEDCQKVFVSGYGTTSESAATTDSNLRRVGVTLIPTAVCDNVFRAAFRSQSFRLDANSLCAGGEPGRDTCTKDGGAPLVCETSSAGNAGSRYLLGISSWGFGCGRAGYPGVYTNTSSEAMATFIRTTTGLTI